MKVYGVMSRPILLLNLGILMLLATQSSYGIEKPAYDVLFVADDIEYRLYQPYLIATTIVETNDSYNKAANAGFMRLFRYISGDNLSREEIEMTSPVQQQKATKISMTAPVQQVQTAQGWAISFMLPGAFTFENAPIPTDNTIAIEQMPSILMAVIRYSGRWTEKNFNKQQDKLRQAIENSNIQILSSAESAVYNPPFMPPFMRHNEFMFEVSGYPDNQ